MRLSLLFFTIISYLSAFAQNPSEIIINQATLAAPEAFRANATVYGFDNEGNFLKMREGTNEMICIGDDPTKNGFSVAAYHKSLEPFMARGRELKKEGLSFKEIFDTREEEVKSGKLTMPERATLFVLSGDFDEEGEPANPHLRYVFYIPYATSESTGLPTGPIHKGGPWIMDPGTHRAHIMITPPKKD